MKAPAAGVLKHRLIFQRSVISDDGYNVQHWENHFSLWGKIETNKTDENEISGQVITESTFLVTCRYSTRISAKHRILYKGRQFEILGEPINIDFENTVTQLVIREMLDAK